MTNAAQSAEGAGGTGLTARVATAFVIAVMIAGCLVLWIGAPIGGMWLASKLTSSIGTHMAVALVLVVSGMLVTAYGLAWLNDLYLRINGDEIAGSGGFSVRRRGPLEGMLIVCLVAALVSFIFWFFVLAENPTVSVY